MLIYSTAVRLCLLAAVISPLVLRSSTDAPAASRFVLNKTGDVSDEQGKKVLDALEKSRDRISNDLKTVPAQPYNVNLYSSRWAYSWTSGNWGPTGSVEGPDKLHLLMVPAYGFNVEIIAVHEFTHSMTLKLLLDHESKPVDTEAFDEKFKRFPVWLWESIAAYEAQHLTAPKKLPFISKTEYPSLDELSNRKQGGKVYKIGYTLIEYIIQDYGQDGLIKLILAYGDLSSLKTDPDELAKKWHAFVMAKYLE